MRAAATRSFETSQDTVGEDAGLVVASGTVGSRRKSSRANTTRVTTTESVEGFTLTELREERMEETAVRIG